MALKKELSGLSSSTKAEIDILKSLGAHPSIIGFKEVEVDANDGVYVVMDYMDTDLRGYMEKEKEKGGLAMTQVQMLMKQLIQGVNFLHQNKVIHRDLKPSNLLVNKGGELKICDFGLSMRCGEAEKELWSNSSSTVGTLWYMAPEVLLGENSDGFAVDMWAVGCILAELVLNKVLFRGKSKEDQLHEIYCILGPPSNKDVSSTISSAKFVLSEAGFDLLKGLLTCDPTERMTAQTALNHAWFQQAELSS